MDLTRLRKTPIVYVRLLLHASLLAAASACAGAAVGFEESYIIHVSNWITIRINSDTPRHICSRSEDDKPEFVVGFDVFADRMVRH